MENIDIFFVALLTLFSFIGLIRGAVREVMSILAWLLAGVVSAWDIPIIREFVKKYFDVSIIADLTTGILAFIIAFILINLIGIIASSFVKKTKLATVDRFFGMTVGLFKGVFLLSFFELILSSFGLRNDLVEYSAKSIFIDKIYLCSDLIKKIIPEEFKEFVSFDDDSGFSKKNKNCDTEKNLEENIDISKKGKNIVEELGKLEPQKIEKKSPDYSTDEKQKLDKIITSF